MKMEKPSILIVDDDNSHRTMLLTLIKGWGYIAESAPDGDIAVEMVKESAFDLILMDIKMIKMSGIEALGKIQEINPSIPVLIMTAYASVDTAVSAMKKGAYDYLTKPLDFDKLKITMTRAMEHISLKKENIALKENLGEIFNRNKIIGKSKAVKDVLQIIQNSAPTEATILITGESGTGKELAAGAIHYNSHRKNGPFIRVNCGAITETLIESELFGHEKGAFTGALRLKEGKFVQAQHGTIFLDEIGTMPMNMQTKLLRVLEDKKVVRVGGEKEIPLDVRVVAATNENLSSQVEDNKFREDLFYRLNVVNINLPPLRERDGDIPLLANFFLEASAKKNRKEISGFSPEAMAKLVRYSWPGNIRELANSVERAVILAKSDYIEKNDIITGEEYFKEKETIVYSDEFKVEPLKEIEKKAIIQTLKSLDNNKSAAARELGITRKTLHKKIKEYSIDD
ncbi:MAG: sigma-54-dependent Fis family transcriptional regulator [Desulfobacteraceae bacterium]|nr:sigma-54-dependent Fis family transcriptional regulator [Desulfobacteraceae bacterium]